MRSTLRAGCICLLAMGCGGGVTGAAAVDAGDEAEGGVAGPCPERQPVQGAPCSTPAGWTALQCEYGPNEDFLCNTLASCETPAVDGDNRWSLAPPGTYCSSVGTTAADAGPAAGCPMPRPHIGTACKRSMSCWYPGTPWPLSCFYGVWMQDPPQ